MDFRDVMPKYRVDYYNLSIHGYAFDKTRYFYNLTLHELYKYLVTYAKDHYNPDLLAIYVSKENAPNVNQIFSIHIGEHIFVEDARTCKCAILK